MDEEALWRRADDLRSDGPRLAQGSFERMPVARACDALHPHLPGRQGGGKQHVDGTPATSGGVIDLAKQGVGAVSDGIEDALGM